MRFPRWLCALALFTVGSLAAAGCAGSSEARKAERAFRRDFGAVFERYRGYEAAKALALAHGEGGAWAYGFARGQEGEVQAVNLAKKRCRRERRRYGVEAACRTYAVGDAVTGDPALVQERRAP